MTHDPHRAERPLAVLAVSGARALGPARGRPHDLARSARRVATWVLHALGEGYRVVLVHGASDELERALVGASADPAPPLYEAVAAAAGVVGQRLARAVREALRRASLPREVTCLLAHALVGPVEPGGAATVVRVGPTCSRDQARALARRQGWRVVEEAGGAWRCVVPVSDPLDIFELESIAALVAAGHVVITGGGGGVPVRIDRHGGLAPCEVLLAPARTASLLATHLDADLLAVLGDEEGIVLDAGRSGQRVVDVASATELASLVREGRVSPTQRDAALAVADFVADGGPLGLVAAGPRLTAALAGRAGTRVTRAGDPSTPRRQMALPLDGDAPEGATSSPSHKEPIP